MSKYRLKTPFEITTPAEAWGGAGIREGRKRQVRRMCEAIGHPVTELTRIAFGPLRLKGLAPGQHRRLTAAEIERLRQSAA